MSNIQRREGKIWGMLTRITDCSMYWLFKENVLDDDNGINTDDTDVWFDGDLDGEEDSDTPEESSDGGGGAPHLVGEQFAEEDEGDRAWRDGHGDGDYEDGGLGVDDHGVDGHGGDGHEDDGGDGTSGHRDGIDG